MTKIETLYLTYRDTDLYKNEEVAQLLGWDIGLVKTYKSRLKLRGLIDVDEEGKVSILAPYRVDIEEPKLTLKGEIYREMLEIYMEDFRGQATFKDRLAVGQEIRLILKHV